MKYTVISDPSVEDELTEIYLQAPDKAAVTKASNAIDRALKHDADRKGRPFHGKRIIVVQPLAATFSVSADDCMVTIHQMQYLGP